MLSTSTSVALLGPGGPWAHPSFGRGGCIPRVGGGTRGRYLCHVVGVRLEAVPPTSQKQGLLGRHTCESGGSCAHSTRPAEQRRCTHASPSRINSTRPRKNKPQRSKRIIRAAIASVVLNSAIASAVTPANPAAAVHTSYAPPSSAAAPTHPYRVRSP